MATLMIVREDHPDAEKAVAQLLRAIGEDPTREGLERTPERVARVMTFLSSGASVIVPGHRSGSPGEHSAPRCPAPPTPRRGGRPRLQGR